MFLILSSPPPPPPPLLLFLSSFLSLHLIQLVSMWTKIYFWTLCGFFPLLFAFLLLKPLECRRLLFITCGGIKGRLCDRPRPPCLCHVCCSVWHCGETNEQTNKALNLDCRETLTDTSSVVSTFQNKSQTVTSSRCWSLLRSLPVELHL